MNIPVGSIIGRPLEGWLGWFGEHWGVYVGDGRVIHFNGERKKEKCARIRRETLATFSAGQSCRVVSEPENAAHGKAIRSQATWFYAQGQGNGFNNRYDMLFRNCQDFCQQCAAVEYA